MKITSANFEAEVLNNTNSLVLFVLPTSGHSKLMEGRVTKLTRKVHVVDASECKEVCDKYGVVSVPTVVVFDSNVPTALRKGLLTEEQLEAL